MEEDHTNIKETQITYEMNYDDTIYNTTISIEDINKTQKIKINISYKDLSQIKITPNFNKKVCYYEKDFSLSELYGLCKTFKCCDTIDDAFLLIKELFQSQNVSINSITNQLDKPSCLNLSFNMMSPVGKSLECIISLKSKYYEEKQLIDAFLD